MNRRKSSVRFQAGSVPSLVGLFPIATREELFQSFSLERFGILFASSSVSFCFVNPQSAEETTPGKYDGSEGREGRSRRVE